MDITVNMLDLPGEGRTMPAQFAFPGNYPRANPGVLVIMEGGGMTEQVKDVARRIAREGYFTIAPDFFYRSIGDTSIPAEGMERFRALMAGTSDYKLNADIRTALNYLKSHGATKLGVTGFCWGGRASFLAAALNSDIAASVPFYGGGIAGGQLTPRTPVMPVDLTPNIKGAVLAFFGDADQFIPTSAAEQVKAALQKHGNHHETHIYKGAGHGFFRDGSEAYHKSSAEDAWTRQKAWFEKYLR